MNPSSASSPTQPVGKPSGLVKLGRQDVHLNQARASIQQAISCYTTTLNWVQRHPEDVQQQATIQAYIDQLSALLTKLDYALVRVAVFGLVSRGKSAVLNGLLGQKVLQTGPLHGVTQWPRSVYWAPTLAQTSLPAQLELIDTPGLDEIEGQARAEMAQTVAQQADLILFVVAGDVTRTEYQALLQLQQSQKPILLVFNKIDLYPDQDRQTIYQKLQTLGRQTLDAEVTGPIQSPEDIVMVAAEPAPMEVRVEWPDGRVTHEWEAPPPQIEALQDKLIQIVQTEGRSLLALNALRESRQIEAAIAEKITAFRQAEAEALIWKYAKYKAIATALNPIMVLDLLGGAIADLVMIRALARLYGLPMTGYEAGKLWRTILKSSGGVLVSGLGSNLLIGMGKSAAAIASVFESPAGLTTLAGAMAIQAGASGYGTYIVGQAAQLYLQQGCTWGPQGANTVIQNILRQVESDSILDRLRQDLEAEQPS